MGHLIGRGRYIRESYPLSPGAAGAGAAFAPLVRQRFIDGDTVQPGLDGSAKDPFATMAQFMASRTNVSIADATANYVGWVMPQIGSYGDVAFPAYASTELRADSFTLVGTDGTVVGNVTWANIAGAFAASLAVLTLHNIVIAGNVSVTDDVGAPTSILVIGGDEVDGGSAAVVGTITTNTTTQLLTINLTNVSATGAIDAGVAATSADLVVESSKLLGAVTAPSADIRNSEIRSAALTFGTSGVFINCLFLDGVHVLTSPLSIFDGDSWTNFVRDGGTRAVGSVVLVRGGYNGAPVAGAALTNADVSVALNGTGATAGFTAENSGNHYTSSVVLTANHTVTLLTAGAQTGDTMLITRSTDADAFTLSVINGGGGAGTIGVIPVSSLGYVLSRFNGVDWIFVSGGNL